MRYLIGFVLLFAGVGWGQSKPLTWVNVGVRGVDTVQTCVRMQQPGFRERWLKTQSCAGVAAYNGGFTLASVLGDRWLEKHGHPKLGKFVQMLSISGSSMGIWYTSTH